MLIAGDVDHHLTAEEQTKVERMVPLHQAKIHLAFRGNLVLSGKKFPAGAIALSEHLVVVCKKSLIGHSFTHVKTFHLLDISIFSTSSDTQCKIVFPNDQILQITSNAVIRFARVLVRNYFVITKMFPANLRFQFRPHETTHFPAFNPRMSPSQIFQFTYNANCSYYDASYEHAVTRFYHSMMISGNGIADLTKIPLKLMEVNLGEPLELRPLFAAWMFCPYVYGVVCHDIVRPDIITSVAPLIVANSNIVLIDLHNCQSENGIVEISDALLKNPDAQVVYWDLSSNGIKDCSPFPAALARSTADVFYLSLGKSGLTSDALVLLFRAIHANKHLWGIKYLDVEGAKFSDEAVQVLTGHLQRLSTSGRAVLRSFNVGEIGGGYVGGVLSALTEWPQPLQSLNLSGTSFKLPVFEQLIDFLKAAEHLRELGVADAGLKPEQIVRIVETVTGNDHVSDFALDLSRNGLNGKKLAPVLQAFREHSSLKWTKLLFDENGMSTPDLVAANDVFKGMANLRSVSLGANFDRRDKALPDALVELLQIRTLETLRFVGVGRKNLQQALFPLFDALKTNSTLNALDVTDNVIGDAGVEKIIELLEANHTIVELHIDGSEVTKPETLSRFLELIAKPETSLHSCDFPIGDCGALIQNVPSAQKAQLFEKFSNQQKLAQDAMQRNQAKIGLHSDLSKKNIPELNDLLDEVTLNMHEKLEGVNVTQHAGLAAAFGLPMPHKDENDDQKQGAITTGTVGPEGTEYGLEQSNVQIVEDTVLDEGDSLKTLQFNSLCIRRPGLGDRVAKPPPSPVHELPPTSEFNPDADLNPDAEPPAPVAPSSFEDF
jgi:hypothetical protein